MVTPTVGMEDAMPVEWAILSLVFAAVSIGLGKVVWWVGRWLWHRGQP